MFSRAYVEISNICNMKCSFCHGHKRTLKMMSINEFDHILNNLEGITKYLYFHLMGEPLLHPEIELFIALAKGKGFNPMLTTNGTLLADNKDMLLSSGLHKINISLHSFEDGNDDSFYRYLSEAADFSSQAADKGIIVVLRLWNNGLDDGRNDQIIDFLRDNICGQWTKNSKGIRIKEKLFVEYGDRFVWPDISCDQYGENVFCYGLRDHFGILVDGTVVPCCLDSDGIIDLGNVFEMPLSEILSSSRAKNIYQGFSERKAVEDLCKKCGYARRFSK